jgi:hypothetical protein
MSAIDERIREIFEIVKSRGKGDDGVNPEAMLSEIEREARLGYPSLTVGERLDAARRTRAISFSGSDLRIVHDGATWQLAGGAASQ